MPLPGNGPFDLSQILGEELIALDPEHAAAVEQAVQDLPIIDEPGRRRALYRLAHTRQLCALSLSGGGIRSASFCLGVIQALAEHGLLQQFQYLSTVSGGGYIGSWLSAWLHHERGFAGTVLGYLRSRRRDADREPPEIEHLRAYSAFLTPRLGLLSADLWAAVAIIIRNILLNWLILIPAIALPVLVVKWVAAIEHSAARFEFDSLALVFTVFCLVWTGLSLGYKLARLYRQEFAARGSPQAAQRRFLLLSLLPAGGAGLAAAWLANSSAAVVLQYRANWWLVTGLTLIVLAGALAGAYSCRGEKRRLRDLDLLGWTIAAIVFATLIWLGFRGYAGLPDPVPLGSLCLKTAAACVLDKAPHPIPILLGPEVLLVLFGIPWFLLTALLGQTAYLLVNSYSLWGDVEREWLGRAGGWYLIGALGWVLLSAIVLLGPFIYYQRGAIVTTLGGVSGIATALLGKSSLTAAKDDAAGWKALSSNIALAVAGPLFAVILLILLSVFFDWLTAACGLCAAPIDAMPQCRIWVWLAIGAGLVVLVALADRRVNVNRFSLHALYRNRLMRAFLGGARAGQSRPDGSPERRPDGFTGFDWNDNLRLWQLWPETAPLGENWRPYHIINMALNLASPNRLAWQQRKASSFVATPQFCGTAELCYRKSCEYGDPGTENRDYPGMTLGTAMAISGAAVSPNMGYHSSPSIAFLLTLFNVRLGWWLGNPGTAGSSSRRQPPNQAPYRQDAPRYALRPLLSELFGTTNEDSPWVYLSDGGHFEDLALYEMVRRRCRWIIVCDGAQDTARKFEDLGNAVRKIWIDLGVRIRFPKAPLLAATKDTKPADLAYYALGDIDYTSDGDPAPTGKLLYIKPAVRGDEGAAEIIAYQRLHPEFPQQSTLEQWFDEPQLEAYRALGWFILHRLIAAAGNPGTIEQFFDGLKDLPPVTLVAPGALEPG